jgi:hypothetical protein
MIKTKFASHSLRILHSLQKQPKYVTLSSSGRYVKIASQLQSGGLNYE